jgi:hypothetical protein
VQILCNELGRCGYEVKSSIRLLNKAVVANLIIITSAHSTTQFSRKEVGGGRHVALNCYVVAYATVPQMPLRLSSAESKFHLERLEPRGWRNVDPVYRVGGGGAFRRRP